MSKVKIGSVYEGAFAIYLSLCVANNKFIPQNSKLTPSLENVKYWMRQIPIEIFEDGGDWSKQFYKGKATNNTNIQNSKPIDFVEVNCSISLKYKEVEGFYGNQFDLSNQTIDGIINKMINDGARYKSMIEYFKNRYFNNTKSDYIIANIKTIGKESELSGGQIKGDVSLQLEVQELNSKTRKPVGNSKIVRFPTMYFSIKASPKNTPKTIGNRGPILALMELSKYFNINVLENENYNKTLYSLYNDPAFFIFKTVSGKRSSNEWQLEFYKMMGQSERQILPTGIDIGTENEIPFKMNNTPVKLFDLLDYNKFPELAKPRTGKAKTIKSYAISQFINAIFESAEPGLKSGSDAEKILNFLIEESFGKGIYQKRTTILSYSDKKFETSSYKYLKEIENAVKNRYGEFLINIVKTGDNLNFYLGDKNEARYKLFHIRYKNRTINTTNASLFNPEDVVKLELKNMVETGPAFKQISEWRPGMNLIFNTEKNSKVFTIKQDSQ